MVKQRTIAAFISRSALGFFLLPLILFVCLSLFPHASSMAAEPVFHFSSGKEGTEPDGSAYRKMELMNRGEAVPASAVEMEDAWCQYYFRQAKAKPEDVRRGTARFITAVHQITPVVQNGKWVVRPVSPVAGTCTMLVRFRYGGQRYIVQKQLNLYGRGWNAKEWQEDMARQNALTSSLPLPYLSFGAVRNFYTGQELSGQYKNINWAVAKEAGVLSVKVIDDIHADTASVVSAPGGEFSYRIPLLPPLQASVWRQAKQRIFAVSVPQSEAQTPLFTEIDFRDNYAAHDNIPHGFLVMVLFAVLTAVVIAFWQRRPYRHGY